MVGVTLWGIEYETGFAMCRNVLTQDSDGTHSVDSRRVNTWFRV